MQKHKASIPENTLHYSNMPMGNSTDHHSTTFINDYELIFLTVHYECGHVMCRPIRRNTASINQLANNKRDIFSPENCKLCIHMHTRAIERRMERNKL